MIPSKDIVEIILALMPGFLAAWVFYGLTAHPRKDAFERIAQALIFTAIIRALLSMVRWAFLGWGQLFAVGYWTKDVELAWSLVIALAFGFIVAALANNNSVHEFFHNRRWNLTRRADTEPVEGWVWTKRTAYPGEWYRAFDSMISRYVVLHLHDRRRIYGWAEDWPDLPDVGHFFLTEADWLSEGKADGAAKADGVLRILVAAADVRYVEFVEE